MRLIFIQRQNIFFFHFKGKFFEYILALPEQVLRRTYGLTYKVVASHLEMKVLKNGIHSLNPPLPLPLHWSFSYSYVHKDFTPQRGSN